MAAKDRLGEIADHLKRAEDYPSITVRELLSWFDAQRRGYWIVEQIREALIFAGLSTIPDFESAYIDSPIRFQLKQDTEGAETTEHLAAHPADGASAAPTFSPAIGDPTYRISKLEAANVVPTSVKPDTKIDEVVTIMLQNDFSQLPAMTNERDVKGVVSWASIGTRLMLKKNGDAARDFMDAHQELRADSSLFDAISTIARHQYVLVRTSDNKISGIVTASDLSIQFQQLAEPFLILGEIENHIRRILDGWFTSNELSFLNDHNDDERVISSVADLTFGEYLRVFENKDRWEQMKLPIDRATFCSELDRVRVVRNDVMHFDPDGILPADLKRLRNFASFLQKLQSLDIG
jgi:CBS domain